MQFIDEYSQHNSIIWLVWLNVRVFVYELCGYGFESRCCHINTFSAQLPFRRSLFSKINNYSEYVLFRSKYFCQTVTFSEEKLYQKQLFLDKNHFLLIVLHDQFHSIHTLKNFSLISIHYFQYMVWFGLTSLKFPNPLLLKIVNNVLILRQDVLQMCLFGKLLVILVSSHKFLTRVWSSSLQAHHAYSTLKRHGHYHVASTWNTRDVFVGLRFIRCCNKNLLKIVENWTARHFKGPRMWQLNFGK